MTSPVFLRPTTASIMQAMTSGLENDQLAISQLQTQIATGNRINKPSDDPAGTVNTLALQAANSQVQRYVTNSSDATSYLGTVNGTINDVLSQLQSLRATVLGAVSGVNNQAGLNAIAQQVESVRQGLLRDANMTYLGQPVFGGSTTNTLAFDTSTGAYIGSGNAPTRVVGPSTTVAISTTGDAIFGDGAMAPAGTIPTDPGLGVVTTANPGGLLEDNTNNGALSPTSPKIGILAQLRNDLSSGNVAAARTDLNYLDAAMGRVTQQAAIVGAAYDEAQSASAEAKKMSTSFTEQISKVQNVDLLQATTALQQDQTSYQAALWAGSKVIQPTLVSYLS